MLVSVYSLEKILYEGDAEIISLPASGGEISVLKNHAPLITMLASGKIILKKGSGFDAEEKTIAIKKGFAEINQREVIVLVD